MTRLLSIGILATLLAGCFDQQNDSSDGSQSVIEPSNEVTSCNFSDAHLSFTDENGLNNVVSGQVHIYLSPSDCDAQAITGRFINQGQLIADSDFQLVRSDNTSSESNRITFMMPSSLQLPSGADQLKLSIQSVNGMDHTAELPIIDLVDVHGPGGNIQTHWVYGDDRPPLKMQKMRRGLVDYCRFDSGRVLVHDANFERSFSWDRPVVDDAMYPAYEFDCTESNINEHRLMTMFNNEGEEEVQTYSMINDAYFYGNFSFDLLEKYLGKRPLEKARMRVHYSHEYDPGIWASWDGAYLNFNDVLGEAAGSASLTIVSHEMAHAILNKHTALKSEWDVEYSYDGKTLHEAFGDMTSVVANYAFRKQLMWVIGEESFSWRKRYLDRIETEPGAIPSYFNYDDVHSSFYKRMGMMTYPFYLLTNKWNVETAYQLFLDSAISCWEPKSTLMQAATCVLVTARLKGLNENDVIESFRAVKIKLKDEDTLSHFEFRRFKLNAHFEDTTQTDRSIVSHHWDFGDGSTSNESDPIHTYAEAGDYYPILTVVDSDGLQDSFGKTISVTDQYCQARTPSDPDREFTSVIIAGEEIGFSKEKQDYTDQIINVNAGVPFQIQIEGDVINEDIDEIYWYVWIDLNDDGFYENLDIADWDRGERFHKSAQSIPDYDLNAEVTISENYVGQTLYMRISGDSASGSCGTYTGSSIDIRVRVN